METEAKGTRDWRKSRECRAVKAELLNRLGGSAAADPLTLSRVGEYMDFWVLRHQLQDDVAARGLYVQDERGRTMENRSVSLSIQASRQMAELLAVLRVSTQEAAELDEL